MVMVMNEINMPRECECTKKWHKKKRKSWFANYVKYVLKTPHKKASIIIQISRLSSAQKLNTVHWIDMNISCGSKKRRRRRERERDKWLKTRNITHSARHTHILTGFTPISAEFFSSMVSKKNVSRLCRQTQQIEINEIKYVEI